MLMVQVVLLPGGDEKRAHPIGLVNIANLTPEQEVCDYEVWEADGRRAIVTGHRRSDGWEPLVARAVNAL